jgi:glycosyltransferase involved in cell wall biosynthesis
LAESGALESLDCAFVAILGLNNTRENFGVLRICFCLSHYYPIASGAERQAHLQAKELIRRGHRVQVVTRAIPHLSEVEEVEGVTVHRTIRPRELGPIFGLTFVTTLCGALKKMRADYDLIHCHQGLWEAVAAGRVGPKLKKPSLVQPAAGGEYGEIRQWARTRGRGLLRKFILRNSHFVAISRQIEQELVDFGVPAAGLTRLASGVDTSMFSPGESRADGLPPRPRVLFLGRLHSQKNLLQLICAWPAVREKMPASLLLVGDGPQKSELVAAAERLGVADSIHFVGAVQDPLQYLHAADVFVLPSVAEGMSNSLLEAMAVGLPAVVSNIGGNTDLIVHNETGLLVDPHHARAWSDALTELLEDHEKASRLGAAARRRVVESFSIEAVVDRYVELYERLIPNY